MSMSERERERRELLARNRAVKGWSFKDLPDEEEDEIKAFLHGGPVPKGYERMYNLCRRQLGLPSDKMEGPKTVQDDPEHPHGYWEAGDY